MLVSLSCTSSNSNNYPSDLEVGYFAKSELMSYEINVEIAKGQIKLDYENKQQNESLQETHTVGKKDLEKLYDLLKSVNFISLKSPDKEMLLDAPEEYLTATYDRKTNKIDLTSVKDIPENIVKVRSGIIDLVEKYDKQWKEKSGI